MKVSGDQAHLTGPGDSLGPVSRAELGQDVAHVLLDGVQDDHELAAARSTQGSI